jgi:hypothetical protein
VDFKNVLRRVQTNCRNPTQKWLPVAADWISQQSGTLMRQGTIHPVIR